MFIKKLKEIIFVLISFFTLATAGVITLQTNCSFSNSTLYVTIKNIGNDTAYGVSVTPFFEGNSLPSKGGNESLAPYESVSFEFPLQVVENGTYLSILSIEYTDSNNVAAYTLAHCLFFNGIPTHSFLLLFPSIKRFDTTKYKIDINVTNIGRVPINSTLFLFLPMAFFSNASSFSFSLSPGETKRFSTEIQYKGIVQGIFEGIAFVSFSLNDKHYTYFVPFPLSTYPQTTTGIYLLSGIIIGIAIVVLVFFLMKKNLKVIK
jgi:hypothetical protein